MGDAYCTILFSTTVFEKESDKFCCLSKTSIPSLYHLNDYLFTFLFRKPLTIRDRIHGAKQSITAVICYNY